MSVILAEKVSREVYRRVVGRAVLLDHSIKELPGLVPVTLHILHLTQLVEGVRDLAIVGVLIQQKHKGLAGRLQICRLDHQV